MSYIINYVGLTKDTIKGPAASVCFCFCSRYCAKSTLSLFFYDCVFLRSINELPRNEKRPSFCLLHFTDYMSVKTQLFKSALCEVTQGLFPCPGCLVFFVFFPNKFSKNICDGDYDHHAVVLRSTWIV